MFALMVCDRMEYNGVVTNYISLLGLTKSE